MEEFLGCAMDVGEQMLLCGAEVHRVEDSVRRMCTAFGASRTDVFIITSSMVVTVYTAENTVHTQTRRIVSGGTDLEKLHRLNDLSRDICAGPMTAAQVRERLQYIAKTKTYPVWFEGVCYGIIAGSFALFFGGGWAESAVAFVVGVLMRTAIYFFDTVVNSKLFTKFGACFVATALAYVAVRMHVIPTVDNVLIGNIMTLIPGIGLTNALRDLFTGDSIAGFLRSVEAMLSALAIAAGFFLFSLIVGGVTV